MISTQRVMCLRIERTEETSERQAAIDFDGLASDVVGLVGQKEEDGFGDVDGAGGAFERNGVLEGLFDIVLEHGRHVGVDIAWGDDVGVYVA